MTTHLVTWKIKYKSLSLDYRSLGTWGESSRLTSSLMTSGVKVLAEMSACSQSRYPLSLGVTMGARPSPVRGEVVSELLVNDDSWG